MLTWRGLAWYNIDMIGKGIHEQIKGIPETHQQGTISLENVDYFTKETLQGNYMKGDFGVQIASDGRVWVCIDGIAFIRFSPHPNGKMCK